MEYRKGKENEGRSGGGGCAAGDGGRRFRVAERVRVARGTCKRVAGGPRGMVRAVVAEGKGRQGGPLFLPTSLRLPRTHLLSVNQHRRTRAHTYEGSWSVVYVRGCSSTLEERRRTHSFVRRAPMREIFIREYVYSYRKGTERRGRNCAVS